MYRFRLYKIKNILVSVVRSFRKQSFKDKFDFNLIFPTTDDAVRHILKAEKDSEDGDKSKVHMIGKH